MDANVNKVSADLDVINTQTNAMAEDVNTVKNQLIELANQLSEAIANNVPAADLQALAEKSQQTAEGLGAVVEALEAVANPA